MEDLGNKTVLYGLEAQGHIPTIEGMIRDGRDWPFIGRAINWDGETARVHYTWYLERKAQNASAEAALRAILSLVGNVQFGGSNNASRMYADMLNDIRTIATQGLEKRA